MPSRKFIVTKKSSSSAIPLDEIEVEITEDGTVKITTPRISTPNHANADAMLEGISLLLGGTCTIEARKHEKSLQQHTVVQQTVKQTL